MASAHLLDEHTPVRGLPVARDEHEAAGARTSTSMDVANVHTISHGRGGSPPAWLLVLALLGGGGAGGAVGSIGIGSRQV